MHPEQAAFEANIDRNPLDATNHLVYADWLDENGQPEEAAFRRSMGNWIHDKHEGLHGKEGQEQWYRAGWGAGGRAGWPEGVLSSDPVDILSYFEYPRVGDDPNRQGWRQELHHRPETGYGPGYEPHHPVGRRSDVGTPRPELDETQPYALRWDTYRGMEEAMRRAFRNGRKQRLSRRISARRISLKRRRGV